MAESTNILDLDNLIDTSKLLVIRLKGVDHVQSPITVEGWLENQDMIAKLGAGGLTQRQEVEQLQALIERSFPTLTKDVTSTMQLEALNRILTFAQNGAEADAGAPASGNAEAAPAA